MKAIRPFASPVVLALLCGSIGCVTYEDHLRKGDAWNQSKMWDSAEQEYELAQKQQPRRPEAGARLQALTLTRAAEQTDLGNAAMKAGNPEGAAAAYAQALRFAPKDAATLAKWRDAVREIAKRHFKLGEDFETAGKLGNALVEFVAADQAYPGATLAKERAFATRKKLLESMVFIVVAREAIDRATSPDVALRLSPGRLGSSFSDKLPIRIVTQAVPGAVGVKVTVAVDRVTFGHDKQSIPKQQRYQSGVKMVPNPKRTDAEKALGELERARRRAETESSSVLVRYAVGNDHLEHAREGLDQCLKQTIAECSQGYSRCLLQTPVASSASAGQPVAVPPPVACVPPTTCNENTCSNAENTVATVLNDVTEARGKLNAALKTAEDRRDEAMRAEEAIKYEAPMLEEPVFADYHYHVEKHTVTVRATMTVTIEDLSQPQAALVPFSEDFVVTHEDFTNPAAEQFGVHADPLELRSEPDLRRDVGDKALADVTRRVMAHFEVYRDALKQAATLSLVRVDSEDMVESCVRALIATADSPPPEFLEAVARARHIRNPAALLSP